MTFYPPPPQSFSQETSSVHEATAPFEEGTEKNLLEKTNQVCRDTYTHVLKLKALTTNRVIDVVDRLNPPAALDKINQFEADNRVHLRKTVFRDPSKLSVMVDGEKRSFNNQFVVIQKFVGSDPIPGAWDAYYRSGGRPGKAISPGYFTVSDSKLSKVSSIFPIRGEDGVRNPETDGGHPMYYAQRLTGGVFMHAGNVDGGPLSAACFREPAPEMKDLPSQKAFIDYDDNDRAFHESQALALRTDYNKAFLRYSLITEIGEENTLVHLRAPHETSPPKGLTFEEIRHRLINIENNQSVGARFGVFIFSNGQKTPNHGLPPNKFADGIFSETTPNHSLTHATDPHYEPPWPTRTLQKPSSSCDTS